VYPLEPGRDDMAAMSEAVLRRVYDFIESLPDRPANGIGDGAVVAQMLAPPPEQPGDLTELLDRLDRAAAHAFEVAGPGYFAYIPGGGLFTAAIGDLYARATNRYVGLAAPAPALAALEHSVVRWLGELCGLPEGCGGLLVSGGSMANFSAVVAARYAGLGEHPADGTLYLTAHAHQSVAKAARLAGLPAAAVRVVPCTPDLAMDIAAARRMVDEDRRRGRRPFLLVASAGTTDTGAVDPLAALAEVASAEGLWYHVDGAYGGLFRLTERGRDRMRGIERADSITLDPHKTLFLPYGTGALVVRDPGRLRAAHEGGGHYLQDLGTEAGVPDFAHLGAELSRDLRGLRVWLPLHLHGVAAFRMALDEKLDLARLAYEKLRSEPTLQVPWEPALSTVVFRMADDDASRRLLAAVNGSGRVFLSSTVVEGRFTLRLCIVSHRTHVDRVTEAIDLIIAAARGLAADFPAVASNRRHNRR